MLPIGVGMRIRAATGLAITLAAGACSDDFVVTPIYNHANGRVVVELTRDLESSETLYVQTRRGSFGVLDCRMLALQIPAVEDASGDKIDGPLVDVKLTKPFYGPEWGLGNPTPEMLASLAAGTDSIIDVCIMDGTKVVAQIERDLFQAWDQGRKKGLGGKADDPSGEVRINSAQEYGVRCVSELGEIPFFEKTGDDEYSTYDCLESTPIPMTVTAANGSVNAPQTGTEAKCDNPQYIYSLCEAGPRVATRINDSGTRWTLLCRKSIGGFTSNKYNDIAMIGHNPFTGKTCFFQNALYQKTDGSAVPHPADKTKSTNLWSGVHGGRGSGIECATCHDGDPFIHTPWIDGAKDGAGRPIVPKMGIDPDLALGALDTPYSIVNLKGQGWSQPRQLVSPEANACLKCHRMGDGRWTKDWLGRLEGTDASWNGITTEKFLQGQHKFWMPPDQTFLTDAAWDASEAKAALDFIQGCGDNPSAAGCVWKDTPTSPGGEAGGGKLFNRVNLADGELAKQATVILGMNKNTPSQVCAECHAPNQTTLRDWQEKTDAALNGCLAATDGGEPREDKETNVGIAKDEFKTFGPYEVAAGATITVKMTGTGDADLHVKRGEEVTTNIYDCRPYGGSSEESCLPGAFNATGPAKFWVGVNGYAASSKINLVVTYKAPGNAVRPASEIVDCLRLEPGRADSPFAPGRAGIFSAAAHLGYFTDTFKQAFPNGEGSNNADTWAINYGKFKNRVSMPKGNHPRLSQQELDIVAEWFVRGLPQLTTYIAPDTGPTSCTPSISQSMSSHVNTMSTQGWGAVNQAAGMNMYNVSNKPDASTKSYGAGWTTLGALKVIRELSFNTYYWMRSSPDGRFVANGATGGDGAVISDLQTGKDIRVSAAYDPGFYPAGDFWLFQGTPIGTGLCKMSLLTSNPDRIDFSESACGTVEGVNLYQHMGQGLNGGDYFTVNSQFTSDNPTGTVNRDPSASFANTATMKLTPMMHNGTRFTAKPSVTTNSPYEGDTVLSPSSRLAVSRIGNENNHLGYVVRQITATPNGASYNVTTTEIGRYCTQGAKPSISFNERFMTTHHYIGANDYADLGYASANDPQFQALLAKGTANIIVIDLVTGSRYRITTMQAGQYALFPHFRSDGWIYFLVRDQNTGKEYAVASDAARNI
jgi:hypothetical protein